MARPTAAAVAPLETIKVLTRLRKKNSLLNATAKFLSVQGPGRLGGPVRKLLAISMTTGMTNNHSTMTIDQRQEQPVQLKLKKGQSSPCRRWDSYSGMTRLFCH